MSARLTPLLCARCVSLCRCRTGVVPKDVKEKVRQLLVTEGPMMQSQFLPKWKKMFPDYQFDFGTWGFERLTALLEALPDLVVITKDRIITTSW